MNTEPLFELYVIRNVHLKENFDNNYSSDVHKLLLEKGFTAHVILENPKITVFENTDYSEKNSHTQIRFLSENYSETKYFGSFY